ncbi:MAG: hypothetical protein CL949_25035 [Erythrobacter sp.]|nr:hypothetical protein [Erythrobacter sp.]|tara:strand:- start:125 stop:400 length:276 start_codon:yes stop_codon:yes gene_type:complete
MGRPITTEAHTRSHRIILDHKELELLIATAAAGMVENYKPRIGKPGVSFKVDLVDATEGSPPYRVGTRAVITIVEDLLPQASGPGTSSEQA